LEARHLLVAVVVDHISVRAKGVGSKHALNDTFILNKGLQLSQFLELILGCILSFNYF
jgi:hypothetical protein